MHCSRAAFQAFIWRHAYENCLNLPSPDGHGWKMNNGVLAIDWFRCDMLPVDVVDLLVKRQSEDEDYLLVDRSEVEEDDEVDNVIDVIFDEDDD